MCHALRVDRRRIALEADGARLTLDPDRGGRIASLVVSGDELIVTEDPGGRATWWGCYPMVPFAGRIRDGAFTFRGQLVQLPLTDPPNAIHGTVLDRPWTVVGGGSRGTSQRAATLTIDLGPGWPFRGLVTQSFELGPGWLTATLTLDAVDAMPATIGWHPWFRRVLAGKRAAPRAPSEPAELRFEPGRMYERGADGLPTGKIVPPTSPPWDDCFVDVRSAPRLVWSDRLALEIESTLDHWVAFTEPPHAVCIEPQSGPPDAVHLAPRVVEAGERVTASMTWRWSAPPGQC